MITTLQICYIYVIICNMDTCHVCMHMLLQAISSYIHSLFIQPPAISSPPPQNPIYIRILHYFWAVGHITNLHNHHSIRNRYTTTTYPQHTHPKYDITWAAKTTFATPNNLRIVCLVLYIQYTNIL